MPCLCLHYIFMRTLSLRISGLFSNNNPFSNTNEMYTLIHHHADFILVSKHPDVSFHKDDSDMGLTERIRRDLGLEKLYPVHRLDRMTSGLLLFATHRDAARELARRFKDRTAHKIYLAISDKRPKKKQGLITGDMVRSRRGSWMLTRTMNNPAKTRFVSTPLVPGLRLYALQLETGKTHQIRVAMKSIGSPVLGDDRYHPREEGGKPDRGYLHAFFLEFTLFEKQYRFSHAPEHGRLFQGSAFFEALEALRPKIESKTDSR